MLRPLIGGLLAVIMPLLAACGAASDQGTVPTATAGGAEAASTASSTPPTPTPTMTKDEFNSEMCAMYQDGMDYSATMAWDSILSSRGKSDHSEQIETLSDLLDSYYESAHDHDCEGVSELSGLQYEISVLKAATLASDEADDDQYQAVADAGNEWLKAIGSDEQFERP